MRYIVFAAAVLLHAALLLAWRPQVVAKPGGVVLETSLYLLAPPRQPTPQQKLAPVGRPRPAAQAARVTPAPAPRVPEPAAITLGPPPDGFADAEKQPGASLLESSRRLAGAIDQQLRKEKDARELVVKPEVDLTERFKEVYNDYSEVPSHATTVGGDRLDRVEGPRGAYCVRTTGNGPGAGRDPFKDAGKQMVVNCPARGPLSDSFVRRKKKAANDR